MRVKNFSFLKSVKKLTAGLKIVSSKHRFYCFIFPKGFYLHLLQYTEPFYPLLLLGTKSINKDFYGLQWGFQLGVVFNFAFPVRIGILSLLWKLI